MKLNFEWIVGMISIKELLKEFSSLLSSSWGHVQMLSEHDLSYSLQEDWCQATWEITVERLLGDVDLTLEFYGDGADCNGASSRILYPSDSPTHRLICKSIKDELVYDYFSKKLIEKSKDDLIFDRFVCLENGWYFEKPPFDKVLALYLDEYVVLDFNEIDFELKPIDD